MGHEDEKHEVVVPLSCGATLTLLKSGDAAEILKISPRSLWTLTKSGTIRCVRIGRSVRYSPHDLEAFINAHRDSEQQPIHQTAEAA